MTTPPIDHRALLVKYMRHVRCCEGIDFTSDMWRAWAGDDAFDDCIKFTDAEWAELQKLAKEAP